MDDRNGQERVHQLLILNRGRKRAPNLGTADRIIAGLCALFIKTRFPGRAKVRITTAAKHPNGTPLHTVYCRISDRLRQRLATGYLTRARC